MRRILGILLTAVAFVALAPAAANAATNSATNDPVIFVHGYTGSASNWTTAETVFRANGYSADQLFAYEYDYNQSNEASASGLADYVRDVLDRTGADEVDLVNHSMGGLVTRWYTNELGGTSHVDQWASLAGANHGTTYASSCTVFASCREMLPGSDFLRELNSGDETPGDVGYRTWFSPCDGVIIPYTSTKVEGATNTRVTCETHIGFLSNTEVLSEVSDYLAA
ncbi:triacylglycerol lipase [Saccharopolyspora lacisalsi]|uniref:Triacylglycerol lipase n=1 Tax=Halosaccharopolyspora lacisalsi TaxID=1000566 RepID=A0A839DU35_9PSEU|nr:alpha/beta fold hydrolase [Halosaccharopolyspora lacisalsi]MBA8824553.1 triacylglycerol lipase [Halosaccharopolyspora lacisalsi]